MIKGKGAKLMEIMDSLEGVHLREKHGGSFIFKLYMTKEMQEAPLDILDLSIRASNCLKRAGYITVGQLLDAIRSGLDLSSIRNCGATSILEIKAGLFLFNLSNMSVEMQERYLEEVVLMNMK